MQDVFVIPAGQVRFDRFDDQGNPSGERYLGNSQAATLTATPQTIATFANENGIAVKADEATTQIERTVSLRLRNLAIENLALFMVGEWKPVSQAGGSVTDEAVGPVDGDRHYQLGADAGNPSGVRGGTPPQT